jgi:hypothetical protein
MSPRFRLHFWLYFFQRFVCHHCLSQRGYLSRPRNFPEKYLLPLMLLRPVRCGNCYRRSLRPFSVALHRRQPGFETNS